MVDFAPLIATAQRLISENGRSVTLVEFDSAPADGSKPWKGAADPRAVPDAELTLDAVFVNPGGATSLGLSLETSDFIKRSEQIMIISPGASVDLTEFEEVLDDAVTWKIQGMEILKPGAEVVVAFIGVRR